LSRAAQQEQAAQEWAKKTRAAEREKNTISGMIKSMIWGGTDLGRVDSDGECLFLLC